MLYSNYNPYEYHLAHYGVVGMRWRKKKGGLRDPRELSDSKSFMMKPGRMPGFHRKPGLRTIPNRSGAMGHPNRAGVLTSTNNKPGVMGGSSRAYSKFGENSEYMGSKPGARKLPPNRSIKPIRKSPGRNNKPGSGAEENTTNLRMDLDNAKRRVAERVSRGGERPNPNSTAYNSYLNRSQTPSKRSRKRRFK